MIDQQFGTFGVALLSASADVAAIFVRDFRRDFRFLGFLFTVLSLSRGGKLTKQFYVDYLRKYFCLFSNEKNTLSLSPLFDVPYVSQSVITPEFFSC